MAGFSLALLAVLCLSPSLFGDRVSSGRRRPRRRRPRPPLGRRASRSPARASAARSPGGRRCARAARRCPLVDASARYAVGCGVNAIAPAHVGSALRVALFGRVTNGGCWTVSGAAAAVGVTRVVWLGALIAIGSAGGRAPALAAPRDRGDRRRRRRDRGHLAPTSRCPAARAAPRRLQVARLLAARSRDRLGLGARRRRSQGRGRDRGRRRRRDRQSRSAPPSCSCPPSSSPPFLPITPGNVGLASAAVALALGSQGVDSRTALSAGIAFGAVELLTGMAIGAAGALALAGPWVRPYLRVAAVGAAASLVGDRVRRHRAAACRLSGAASGRLARSARAPTRSRSPTTGCSTRAKPLPVQLEPVRSSRISAWSSPSSGSWKSRTRTKPAFSNARIEARLRTSGSATHARVSARAKTTSDDEGADHLACRARARSGRSSPMKTSRPAASSPASTSAAYSG